MNLHPNGRKVCKGGRYGKESGRYGVKGFRARALSIGEGQGDGRQANSVNSNVKGSKVV